MKQSQKSASILVKFIFFVFGFIFFSGFTTDETVKAINSAGSQLRTLNAPCATCGAANLGQRDNRPSISEECPVENSRYHESQFRDLLENADSGMPNLISSYIAKKPNQFLSRYEQCIEKNMESSGGPFIDCSSGKEKYADKSCMSDSQKTAVFSSFEQASSCLSSILVQPKESYMDEMFSLISVESGFHSNARSKSGSNGIGQITGKAVADLERNKGWDRLTEKIKSSDAQSCKNISTTNLEIFKTLKTKKGAYYFPNRCETVSPKDGNPLRNMLLTFAYQNQLKNGFIRAFSKNDFTKNLKEKNPKNYLKLLQISSLWAHNIGFGFNESLSEALTRLEFKKSIEQGDFKTVISTLKTIIQPREENRCLKSNENSKIISDDPNSKKAKAVYKICRNRGTETGKFMTAILEKLNELNTVLFGTKPSTGEQKCGISI